MAGAYSYPKSQGFLGQNAAEEPLWEAESPGPLSSVRGGSAIPVAFCSPAAIAEKSATDQLYDEQDQKKATIEEIRKRETPLYQWLGRSLDPVDFGEAVKRDFATKVVPYVQGTFKNWENLLQVDGVDSCSGPKILKKKKLAGLFGTLTDNLMSLDAAAAVLIFLATGSATAEALTAEQLEAFTSQLVPTSTARRHAQPRP